jgi:hypothetical protein
VPAPVAPADAATTVAAPTPTPFAARFAESRISVIAPRFAVAQPDSSAVLVMSVQCAANITTRLFALVVVTPGAVTVAAETLSTELGATAHGFPAERTPRNTDAFTIIAPVGVARVTTGPPSVASSRRHATTNCPTAPVRLTAVVHAASIVTTLVVSCTATSTRPMSLSATPAGKAAVSDSEPEPPAGVVPVPTNVGADSAGPPPPGNVSTALNVADSPVRVKASAYCGKLRMLARAVASGYPNNCTFSYSAYPAPTTHRRSGGGTAAAAV